MAGFKDHPTKGRNRVRPSAPKFGNSAEVGTGSGLLGIATMVNQQSGVSFNLLCLVVTEINLRDVGMTIPLDSFMF